MTHTNNNKSNLAALKSIEEEIIRTQNPFGLYKLSAERHVDGKTAEAIALSRAAINKGYSRGINNLMLYYQADNQADYLAYRFPLLIQGARAGRIVCIGELGRHHSYWLAETINPRRYPRHYPSAIARALLHIATLNGSATAAFNLASYYSHMLFIPSFLEEEGFNVPMQRVAFFLQLAAKRGCKQAIPELEAYAAEEMIPHLDIGFFGQNPNISNLDHVLNFGAIEDIEATSSDMAKLSLSRKSP